MQQIPNTVCGGKLPISGRCVVSLRNFTTIQTIFCSGVGTNFGVEGTGEARPKGPKPEVKTAENAEWGFGGGAASPIPTARGSGERCKLPSGVRGRAPAAEGFSCITRRQTTSPGIS